MALRFNIDRCTPANIVGWIDDDGPVDAVDVELNGTWIFRVSPQIHRADLAAAGYGDGNRGFCFSILPYLGGVADITVRVALKCNNAIFYEGVVDTSISAEIPSPDQIGSLAARLAKAEESITSLAERFRFEQSRMDAALFLAEQLTDLRDEFLLARATAEYQSVFEKPEPLVSVCIATMNRAQLLVERALSSLLEQTYRNLQIVVVGDHCTDDTAEQIARLRDPRITFVNLERRGPYPPPGFDRWMSAGAMPGNRSLELAEGDFITHLDEDDTFDPRRIEILVDTIRKCRADLVFHSFWWQELSGEWTLRGNGRFEMAETGTGMVLYHRYLARVPWDVFCYRLGEPGDWNLLRKLKMMRVRTAFVPEPLTRHYHFPQREPFVPEPGEDFLE